MDVPTELRIHATNATTVGVVIAYWENDSVLVNGTFELPSGGFLDFDSELSHRTDYDATVSVGDGQVWNHRLSPSISFERYEDEVVQSPVGSGNAWARLGNRDALALAEEPARSERRSGPYGRLSAFGERYATGSAPNYPRV